MQIYFRTEIEKLIYEKLVKVGSVVIPQFGLLFIAEKSAEIEFISSRLIPPERKLTFLHASELQDYALAFSLHLHKKIPFEDAVGSVDSYREDIITSLVEKKEYTIESLGTFVQDGDTVGFVQAKRILPGIQKGYKSIPFVPINRFAEQVKEGPVHVAQVQEKKGSRIPWTAIGVPLLLIVLTALLYRIYMVPSQTEVTITPASFYDEQRLNIKPEEGPKTTFNDISEAETSSDDLVNEQSMETEMENESEASNTLEAISDDLPETISKGSDDVHVSSPECVIIVGAFGSQRNVERMIGRIRAIGFEPYQDQKSKLNRVGIVSDCERQELLSTLRLCRKELEPSAWILNLE